MTTLTFVLPRAQRVVFTVKQVSPECRTVGRFVVRGHAGLNRVRFAGRVDNKQLGPGTYRIIARVRGGTAVRRVTLVVVDGPAPTQGELASLLSSNVCPATNGIASTAINSTGATNFFSGSDPLPGSFAPGQRSASGPSLGSTPHSGVLASAVEKTAQAIRPALVALFAAAILLLGVASLPRFAVPDPRLNDALARHRLEIAGVGAAALIAVVISFLIV